MAMLQKICCSLFDCRYLIKRVLRLPLTNKSTTEWGENLAANSGTGTWGALRTTEQVVARFVEREADWDYPDNSHLTQVSAKQHNLLLQFTK